MTVMFLFCLALLAFASCHPEDEAKERHTQAEDHYSAQRNRMVDEQIVRRGIRDTLVLAAMRRVPRHEFVPESYRKYAYADEPLPIGEGQTISQPYIVALMTETLGLNRDSKVLEIGTGSGYQAAVLAEVAREVCSIEIVGSLSERAAQVLSKLEYKNVKLRCGDGYRGWPEEAPFDAIIVTAAPDHVPEPLVEQLKVGGRMSIPVGDLCQELLLLTKKDKGYVKKDVLPVRFVPMTGEAETK
ncbi:MAG: protein-L-isoaspartate(D-aspartate) O-methyltransferase [Candidatus Eisenbacteria bacterium]